MAQPAMVANYDATSDNFVTARSALIIHGVILSDKCDACAKLTSDSNMNTAPDADDCAWADVSPGVDAEALARAGGMRRALNPCSFAKCNPIPKFNTWRAEGVDRGVGADHAGFSHSKLPRISNRNAFPDKKWERVTPDPQLPEEPANTRAQPLACVPSDKGLSWYVALLWPEPGKQRGER
ncbi:hypothetical protein GCM10010461_26240 [Microbacterium aurantiacum]